MGQPGLDQHLLLISLVEGFDQKIGLAEEAGNVVPVDLDVVDLVDRKRIHPLQIDEQGFDLGLSDLIGEIVLPVKIRFFNNIKISYNKSTNSASCKSYSTI